jgi:Subtilase family
VITAGAVDDKGTRQVSDDELASWSSRGTTQDGFRKPEVLAPGASLVSTLALHSDLEQQCRSCVVDGQYFRMIIPETGLIDYARASFRRASFRSVSDSPLDAVWSRASFRCVCPDETGGGYGAVDDTRASFRRASYRVVSFKRTADFSK